MNASLIRLSVVLLAAIVSGCVMPVSSNIKASEAHVAKYKDLSDLAVVAELEKSVNEARVADMPFLAPGYFRDAAEVLSECQNALGNQPREVLVNDAAKGDAILEKGRAVMAIVQYRFAKELEFKAQLDEHNTAKLLPKDYEKVIGDLSGLIGKVEREQAGNIDKEKEALQKAMLDLVIRAVQEGVLRESEAINTDSKKKNAEKQAPLTYADALRVYQEAKSQIAAAHHDQKLVQRLGTEALFAARHAQQINERVALLQTQLKVSAGAALSAATGGMTGSQVGGHAEGKPSVAEKVSVEKIILQEEDRLLSISTALGLKDLRDQPLEKQADEIQRAAESARHTGSGVPAASVQDYEARLKAANDAIQQMSVELGVKDQQTAEKDKQLAALTAQLAEKDEQIRQQKERIDRWEREKPTEPAKATKPRKAKAKEAAAEKK